MINGSSVLLNNANEIKKKHSAELWEIERQGQIRVDIGQ